MNRINLFLPLVAFVACNNYGLDDRIRNAISGSSGALSLTAPANQFIIIQNRNLTMASLQFTATGGSQPYSFSFTQSNLPANFIVTISSTGLLTLTRNTSAGYPATIQTSDPLPVGSISVKVTDSGGTNQEVLYPINVHFKRAFITSGQDLANFGLWGGGFTACSGQPNPVAKANCVCQNAASNANMPTALKFRAWISATSPATDAKCNITNNSSLSGCTTAATDGGPWYTTAGNRLAIDMGTSAPGSLLSAATPLDSNFDKDEFGATSGGVEAHTATQGTGVLDNTDNCTNWTGAGMLRAGLKTTLTNTWTLNGTATSCAATQMRLYCFETD